MGKPLCHTHATTLIGVTSRNGTRRTWRHWAGSEAEDVPLLTPPSSHEATRASLGAPGFQRAREAVRPTSRFLDPHDPSVASRPQAILAYNPGNMTEDEREHLLSTVGQAHAGLSEVALKLRLGLPPKTPALKTAIKAERVAFDLKRSLQRIEVKDVETITRRAPLLPEVRRGGKVVDPESLLRHEKRHDERLTGFPRRNNPRRSG